VPVGTVGPNRCRLFASRAGYACGLALLIFLFGCRGLQNALADGETRTITMHHVHTNETITITYKRDGRYDEAALEKLNWFLRDWRRGQETHMDPALIDLLWEVQRETGSDQPIYVVCGYRAPETNAMLRRRSSGVARFSQHMLGHAVDFYIPGVPLEQLRAIGLRLQRGGVGFYPTSGSPFVHMDTGGVRMWPRMSREQLLRVFPDGRTVYLPSDGHPLDGYALALAELRKRGQDPTVTWFDEARAQGFNRPGLTKNIELASNEHSRVSRNGQVYDMADADEEADAREAARTAPAPPALPPPTPAPAMNALQAALERLAARRREEIGLATAPGATSGAVYQTASYTTDDAPKATGAINRVSVADADNDHVPVAVAFAYAVAPEQTPAQKPMQVAQASAVQPTTAAVVATHPRAPSAATAGARFDDPWLAAVMVSPSVRNYLTVLMLGKEDYSTLASLVVKPAESVLMTFGAEPNPGLTDDRFSGSAVVFVATVTYRTQTAALH
jgi:uncharacterized protein YcbK (DUF882 family)